MKLFPRFPVSQPPLAMQGYSALQLGSILHGGQPALCATRHWSPFRLFFFSSGQGTDISSGHPMKGEFDVMKLHAVQGSS